MTKLGRVLRSELLLLLERAEARIKALEDTIRQMEIALAAAEEMIKSYKLGIGFYKVDGGFASEVRLDGKEGEDRG